MATKATVSDQVGTSQETPDCSLGRLRGGVKRPTLCLVLLAVETNGAG